MVADNFDSLRAKIQAATTDNERRSESPVETTPSGIVPGHAAFDTPPSDSQLHEPAEPRSRKRSEKGDWYDQDRKNRSRSRASGSQASGGRKRGRSSAATDKSADGPASKRPRSGNATVATKQTNPPACGRAANFRVFRGSSAAKSTFEATIRVLDSDDRKAELRQLQARKQALKDLPQSPTPGSTDAEPELYTQADDSSKSAGQLVFESGGYHALVEFAKEKVNQDLSGWNAEDIIEVLNVSTEDQTPSMANPRLDSSIVMLAPQALTLGSNRRQNSKPAPAGRGTLPSGPMHTEPARGADPNTDTESETDDDTPILNPVNRSVQTGSQAITSSAAYRAALSLPAPETLGRESTASTILEFPKYGRPTGSQTLGADSFTTRGGTLPMILTGRHTLNELAERGQINELDLGFGDEEMADGTEGVEQADRTMQVAERAGQVAFVDEVDEVEDVDEVEEVDRADELDEQDEVEGQGEAEDPEFTRPLSGRSRVLSQRTYAGARSHVDLSARPDHSPSRNDPRILPPPRSVPRHGARSIFELAAPSRSGTDATPSNDTAAKAARAKMLSQSRLNNPVSVPKLPPGLQLADSSRGAKTHTNTPRSHAHPAGSGSMNPTSTRRNAVADARHDMVTQNQRRIANKEPSLLAETQRQTARQPRCEAPVSRPPTELLPDNEEDLAHAEALQKGTEPACGRKQKPLARHSTGLKRHALTAAKIHFFIYAVMECIYQMRATFMVWAAVIHESTWFRLYPDIPYQAALQSELEVMVNNMATMRGKVKDRIRPLVEYCYGFNPRVVNEADIQANKDIYNDIYPNSFHCTNYRPRKGHYESEFLARCIAAAIFYGVNSPGFIFAEYFDHMPLPVVAFVLAIMQFCIQEWSNGYWVSLDLGAAHMLEKYEMHMEGLRELRRIAPRRLQRMQDYWANYALDYAGASLMRQRPHQAAIRGSEMRADTPPPEISRRSTVRSTTSSRRPVNAMASSSRPLNRTRPSSPPRPPPPSPAEYEALLNQTPGPLVINDNHSSTRSHEHSPPPLPIEYNEHGNRTAKSLGKNRATD